MASFKFTYPLGWPHYHFTDIDAEAEVNSHGKVEEVRFWDVKKKKFRPLPGSMKVIQDTAKAFLCRGYEREIDDAQQLAASAERARMMQPKDLTGRKHHNQG